MTAGCCFGSSCRASCDPRNRAAIHCSPSHPSLFCPHCSPYGQGQPNRMDDIMSFIFAFILPKASKAQQDMSLCDGFRATEELMRVQVSGIHGLFNEQDAFPSASQQDEETCGQPLYLRSGGHANAPMQSSRQLRIAANICQCHPQDSCV